MSTTTRRVRFAGTALTIASLTLTGFANGAWAVALTGTVSSAQEGMMERVVISAKKQGGTISLAVVSNSEGRYSFPSDRLSAGNYDIVIRAVGSTLPATTVTLAASGRAELNLSLDAVSDKISLGKQLSNAEWMLSAGEDGARLGECVSCHTLAQPMFSHYGPEQMAKVVQRMSLHTNNASIEHPWFDTDASQKLALPPADDHIELDT